MGLKSNQKWLIPPTFVLLLDQCVFQDSCHWGPISLLIVDAKDSLQLQANANYLPAPWTLVRTNEAAYWVTSSISPYLMTYINCVFSTRALPSGYGKLPIALELAFDIFWESLFGEKKSARCNLFLILEVLLCSIRCYHLHYMVVPINLLYILWGFYEVISIWFLKTPLVLVLCIFIGLIILIYHC